MRFTVKSAHGELLEGGTWVAPEQEVSLTAKAAEENKRLVDEGVLVPVEKEEEGDTQ